MIRYHKKKDGILRIAPDGNSRYLTLWEILLYKLGYAP